MLSRARALLILGVAVAAIAPSAASASELISRNATNVTLQVAKNGQALVSFKASGKQSNVLVWNAINAIAPTTARPQVSFKLDYSGGYGTYKRNVWKTFKNACTKLGPQQIDEFGLHWVVTACRASDGSYWAIQSWQRMLPNYGLEATKEQAVWELRLSHWQGELPVLTVNTNWAHKTFDHLFGSFTYLGKPVHGFKSTPAGMPLDTFGRNLFVDTFNSTYGKGWLRENSFLMHKGTGMFCYGFFPHGARPVGKGERYRATIIGPGVTPDIYWEGEPLGAYDKANDLELHQLQKDFLAGDPVCKAV